MKKLLLILGITNFIAIETSLIISCSNKLTKPIERATNPTQCRESCELQFSEILNTVLFRDNYSLNIENVKNKLPWDVLASTSGYALFEIKYVDGRSWQKIINFYKDNGVKSSDNNRYSIDKIINAKIILTKFESRYYYITSFSAEMPPLPEKDNEQPNPRANHFKI